MFLKLKLKYNAFGIFLFLNTACTHPPKKNSQENLNKSRIVLASNSLLAFVDALESWDCIVGLSELNYIENKDYKQKIQAYNIENIGSFNHYDIEHIVSLNPDLVVLNKHQQKLKSKLASLSINTVEFAEYLEQDPISQLKYIIEFSKLVNKEKQAQLIFDSISDLYAQQQVICQDSLSILHLNFLSNTWIASTDKSVLGTYFKQACFSNKVKSQPSTKRLSLEQVIELSDHTDYLSVMVHDPIKDIRKVLLNQTQKFKYLKPFNQQKIIYINTYYDDFFGRSILEPHLVLKDLKSIYNKEDRQRKYIHVTDL